MSTPLLITLIAVASLAAVAVAFVILLRFGTPLLVRTNVGRKLLGRIAKLGMRAARKRAERDGTTTDASGARLSDAELMLREHGGAEARELEAMMARIPVAQRAQMRRMMDNLDVSAMAEQLRADEGGDLPLGRDAKRALARIGGAEGTAAGGARTLTPAQRKAKAKRRAARKRSRTR